jgi:phage terminase large subunit
MISAVEIYKHPKFDVLYDLPAGTHTVVCIGGRAGMKTYEVSKFAAVSATIKKKRIVVIRDEKSRIKESILAEIWERYDTANENGLLDKFYSKNETELKDLKTGKTLIYTKGFRASDNQKRANLKGEANIDIAIVEEGEDIRDEDKFNTFVDSLRKEGAIVIILLNTPDVNHFIIRRYFNTEQAKDDNGAPLDGYFRIHPKQIPGFVCIQTSFEDNPYLPAHVISNYHNYGNPDSHLYNPFYYYTAIKGFASTGRKGQILTKVKPIKLADYLKLPFKEIYGQDFGTASPAGLVGVKFEKNNCYCRQINYKPLPVKEIGKMYSTLKFGAADKIIGDSAEPDTIGKLKKGWTPQELTSDEMQYYPTLTKGFFIEACPTKDIEGGISLMTSLNLYAVEESKDLWNEINNYVYAVDKNKMPTDTPVDDFNHLIDPWRYVVSYYKPRKTTNLSQLASNFR